MIVFKFLILILALAIEASHFNGGSISWTPLNPNTNGTTVSITIIQSYSWVLSEVDCKNNVPVTTSGRSDENENLTCIAGCGNDGGYSGKVIDVLTDCISSSTSLDMMKSQRARNITLNTGAYFVVGFQDGKWRGLENSESDEQWSITSLIDLRRRPDGLINTPPVSNVVSPQYVIVNQWTQITIPVYDVNQGDDVRCRWAKDPGVLSVDECASVCFSNDLPSGTNISNCVLTFRGTSANKWYAITLQVEDFINKTSTTPMSSVSVQFLINVLPTPLCSLLPVILPITNCLEVQVGLPVNITLFAMNKCNRSRTIITDLAISMPINGMNTSRLFNSTANTSLSFIVLTWTPQSSQIGQQDLCAIAYTNEKVQSEEYCATVTVKTVSDFCQTTTTSTTSTTSRTTTTTSRTTTTSTTSRTTTSTTTTRTTSTTTTSVTTTSTTTTRTTSTTTTTTTTATTTSTTSTTTTTTTTATTTSTTSTTTTRTTTSTTTSTTSTTTTRTTSTTTTSSTSSTSTSTSTTSTTTSTSTSTTSSSTTTTSTTSKTTSTSTSSSSTSTTSTTTSTSTSSTSSSSTTTSTTSSTTSTSTSTTSSSTTTTSTTSSTTSTSTSTTSSSTSTTSTTSKTTSSSTTSTSSTSTTTSTTSTTTSTTTSSTSTTSVTTSTTSTTTSTSTSSTSSTSATTSTTTTSTTTSTTSITTTTATTATTTTKAANSSSSINIFLVVGLSLLALLLSFCCCGACLWYYYFRPKAQRRRKYRDEESVKTGKVSSSNRNDFPTKNRKNTSHNQSEASFRSIANDSGDIESIEIPDNMKKQPSSTTKVHSIERTSETLNASVLQPKSAKPTHSAEKPSKSQRSAVTVRRLNKVSSCDTADQIDVTKSSNNFQSMNEPDPPQLAENQSNSSKDELEAKNSNQSDPPQLAENQSNTVKDEVKRKNSNQPDAPQSTKAQHNTSKKESKERNTNEQSKPVSAVTVRKIKKPRRKKSNGSTHSKTD